MEKLSSRKHIQDSKEEFCEDDNEAFIKPSLLRPTKYDHILSVIKDCLVLETTNYGMPPIAEYHVAGDSLDIVYVEKILFSFTLDR
ncbi:MAG: hypothetical protein JO297_08030 [Nitrososphaeraceae archaeon]|nr:hypothetical protein [Nitrososphaeraceae archaeon]